MRAVQVAYLHQVGVDDVLLGQEPVLHLLRAHDWSQVELTEIILQQAVHNRDILHRHRPQASGLRSLETRRRRLNEGWTMKRWTGIRPNIPFNYVNVVIKAHNYKHKNVH